MCELLAYLATKGFTNYIASGGDRDFMRGMAQDLYGIPPERIYAHNWIDYKDARYCEGCELAERARAQAYRPSVEKPQK